MNEEDNGPNLKLDQGMVRMTNGAPSGEYLRKWQMKNGHADGTPIRIITDEDYQELLFARSVAGVC